MVIYRKYINAKIKGFTVVARGRDGSADANLLAGGISEDFLKIAVKCNSSSRCQIGIVVYTDKENPDIITKEPSLPLPPPPPAPSSCVIA
jgi:hypothetical protein